MKDENVVRRRLTIRIDEELLGQAKQLATRSGKSLSAVIVDALRESLADQRRATAREPVQLITVAGNGLLPGVDLDHSASLWNVTGTRHDCD